ncbi:MAG TPA: hypothetical protein VMW15_08750 [Terracidiphilus sp.]|nr:hypothetical protein [Terracidiphilus sp.]
MASFKTDLLRTATAGTNVYGDLICIWVRACGIERLARIAHYSEVETKQYAGRDTKVKS